MTDKNTPWEELYQQGDTGWDRGKPSPALEHWLNHGLTPKQHMLIPGCGLGHEVIELARLGFEVTGLDIAPSAVQDLKLSLQQKKIHATVLCRDLFHYAPDHCFDAIYEQTCLCALPLEQRQAYANKIYSWLKPGGHLYFSMMQTGEAGGPPYHCDCLDMQQLFPTEQWQWPTSPPTLIARPQGTRYELTFLLTKLNKD